jgi:hypothetical protein
MPTLREQDPDHGFHSNRPDRSTQPIVMRQMGGLPSGTVVICSNISWISHLSNEQQTNGGGNVRPLRFPTTEL